ncbi:MAG: hypothetical protein JWO85_577 [Candidatus Eremiobacteraeota bacterium]|nr:hypothetical protein [Candidatus Eremiobacteraeota bacterium]
MTALFAATNTFVADQTSHARKISAQTGRRFDDLLDSVLRSARQQGFAAITLIGNERDGFHLQWVGADAYTIHGTWYLAKRITTREAAIRQAKAWYDQRPDLNTVYDGTADLDESYGICCSLGAQAGRRMQVVA